MMLSIPQRSNALYVGTFYDCPYKILSFIKILVNELPTNVKNTIGIIEPNNFMKKIIISKFMVSDYIYNPMSGFLGIYTTYDQLISGKIFNQIDANFSKRRADIQYLRRYFFNREYILYITGKRIYSNVEYIKKIIVRHSGKKILIFLAYISYELDYAYPIIVKVNKYKEEITLFLFAELKQQFIRRYLVQINKLLSMIIVAGKFYKSGSDKEYKVNTKIFDRREISTRKQNTVRRLPGPLLLCQIFKTQMTAKQYTKFYNIFAKRFDDIINVQGSISREPNARILVLDYNFNKILKKLLMKKLSETYDKYEEKILAKRSN